jgi:hypothetical protein
MMGNLNNPSKYDCEGKAHPDEPRFTLLGRDLTAPWLVGLWRALRAYEPAVARNILEEAIRIVAAELPDEKFVPLYSEKSQEADQCASAMREWYLKGGPGLPVSGTPYEKEVRPPNGEDMKAALYRTGPPRTLVETGPIMSRSLTPAELEKLFKPAGNIVVGFTATRTEIEILLASSVKIHITSSLSSDGGRLWVRFTGLGADGYCFPQQIIANGVDILYGFKKAVPNDPNTGTGGKAGDDQRPG